MRMRMRHASTVECDATTCWLSWLAGRVAIATSSWFVAVAEALRHGVVRVVGASPATSGHGQFRAKMCKTDGAQEGNRLRRARRRLGARSDARGRLRTRCTHSVHTALRE